MANNDTRGGGSKFLYEPLGTGTNEDAYRNLLRSLGTPEQLAAKFRALDELLEEKKRRDWLVVSVRTVAAWAAAVGDGVAGIQGPGDGLSDRGQAMRNILYPIIGTAAGSLAVWLTSPQFDAFMAARWYEVHSVTAAMEPGAEWPIVKLERSIHKPFTGTWTTTLWRQEGSGFVRYCSHDGRNDYLPDAILPKRTDLNWWMGVPPRAPCRKLKPGRYKMSFDWIVIDDGQALHAVRAQSNVFNVPG